MTLAPGTRLGVYEIAGQLGAGGMGEVYRATDTELKRQVALKVLRSELDGPDRVARFRREAELLASLNHPNIAHLYGLEQSGAALALVMELVPGPTLADRISQGPLLLPESLRIATQIAEALEAAHEQAIVHRDLKPANIKVRDDDTVKVLDFGLAKAIERVRDEEVSPATLNDAATVTSPALMTGAGVVLGTAAYMSPEQARGRSVDRRADVWAFGCVLFEMLSGARAFPGDTVADTMAAVVGREPEWTVLPNDTPTALRRLLRRMLQKDARQRMGDIRDARLELEELATEPAEGGDTPKATTPMVPLSRGRRVGWSVLATAVVASGVVGAGAMWWRLPRPVVNERVYRTEILPPGEFGAAPALRLALSPDGRRLALIALNDAGRQALWIRALDQGAAQLIAGTEGASSPFWSPDSRFVAFIADNKLKKVNASGGAPITLTDARTNPPGTWNRDDVILFTPGLVGGLARVSAAGGTAVPVTRVAEGERVHVFPHFLPDGDHFFYTLQTSAFLRGGIMIGSLSSGEVTPLVPDNASNAMYANGHVFFMRGTTLMAQPFEPAMLKTTGDAVPIAEELITNPVANQSGGFSVSTVGSLAFQMAPMTGQLAWRNRTGRTLERLGEPQRYGDISLAPDESQVAFTLLNPDGTSKVWALDLVRGVRALLTPDVPEALTPVWAPSSDALVYAYRDTARKRTILRQIKLGALESRELSIGGDEEPLPLAWSGDNRLLLGQATTAIRGTLGQTAVNGEGPPVPYLKTIVSRYMAQFSPDGKWVAYVANDSGRDEVYLSPFPEATERIRVSTAGGALPRWRRDGTELFFVSGTNSTGGTLTRSILHSAAIAQRSGRLIVGAPVALFEVSPGGVRYFYDVSADGQRFLVNSANAHVPSVTFVVNWPAVLKR